MTGQKNLSSPFLYIWTMKKFALLLFGCYTLAACTKPQDLEFIDVSNVRMISMGFKESLVGVDVRFYNPNNQQVKLKDVEVSIAANSTHLGNTKMDSVVMVPRKDTFSVPLVLKVNTLTTISRLIQTLSDSTVAIKVDGSVKMGKAGIFVNYPIHYEKLQTISDLNL
jgi:LEA14-like dessication related protein